MTSLRVLRVQQPIGEFYIGAIDSRTLNSIATVDVRRFKEGSADDIAGIQRELSPQRVRKISEYVNFDYATFPTSVVLAVDERCAKLVAIGGCNGLYDLTISAYDGGDLEESIPLERSAFIIDGQYRLAGLDGLEASRDFDVNVSIFIGADLADQAEVFSTVNLAQTKVNRSLVYDLFSYADSQSPFKMAHEITIALDRDRGGPFYHKIKRLGTTNPERGGTETLSQATVVRGILRHFPANPEKERNKGFLGLSTRPEQGESWRRQIFSSYYRSGDSISILNIVRNYFGAVQDRWPSAWDDITTGFILNRTNGYNALIRFIQDLYLKIVSDEPRVVTRKEFYQEFSKIDIKTSDFVSTKFLPGSSGASQLYKMLLEKADL